MNIYLATVCLERNRWGSRQPSFAVSDWLGRFRADGFDGVELWENHYLAADEEEKAGLIELGSPVAVYNSYVGFETEEPEQRQRAAEAVCDLSAIAVKYNLGGDPNRGDEYRRNLLEWSAMLPESCRLLCECHPGTVLESRDAAADYFADLDPHRHGAIVHISGDPDGVEAWFTALGPRIVHLHLQMRTEETSPTTAEGRQALDACFAVTRSNGFDGSMSIEFTRGIGRNEDIEQVYSNACADLAYCRKATALH